MKRDDKFSPVKNSPNVVVVVVVVVAVVVVVVVAVVVVVVVAVAVVVVVGSSLFKACETKLWFQPNFFHSTEHLNSI